MHLRLLCICIINQFFTQQQGSREKEWKGSIHQLVFLTFGVRMNADCHCSETGEKNSLYCKEKTTAATLFRPQHLSPFALLQQWMTTSELLAQEKPKMKTASLCKILLTSLKLCGLWLIVELNDRSLKVFCYYLSSSVKLRKISNYILIFQIFKLLALLHLWIFLFQNLSNWNNLILLEQFSKAARGRPEGPTDRSVFKFFFDF